MTTIVFKPEANSGTLKGRGLYRAYMNQRPLDLLVRAKNATEADAMLQYLFRKETAGKTLRFDLPKDGQTQEVPDDVRRDNEGAGE